MRRGLRIPALPLAASLVLAACGGGGGGGGGSPAASGSAKCPSGVHFPASVNDHGAKPMSSSTVALTAGDFFFSPTCTTSVSSSSTVVLRVHNNSGQTLHNVSVPSQGIDQDVVAGQTITVRIKVGSTPLVFFCKYHKTSGMYGALVPSG
jgi:plastocyanin